MAHMIPPESAPAFLAAHGWQGAIIAPLAGDASFRRYFHVTDGDRTAVLMDAPPPHENPEPFIVIAEGLLAQGLSAPAILAADLHAGLVLIEDFGVDRMREAIDADPDRETELYYRAVEVLAHLHSKPALPLRPYDLKEYLREVNLFTDWYCPAMGLDVDHAGWEAAWQTVLQPVLNDNVPPVTVLRDYHAENIMLLPRDGIASFGLLDFQDALVGHPAYDLVSMLQDARRDVSTWTEQTGLVRYEKAAQPGVNFATCYNILALQRNIKILGIFTRLWKRDNKPHYTSFQPRMWGYVARNLRHPAVAPVAAWMDANVPMDKRAAAWANMENIA
jgi:N-acetylmuramate 1-kinase